jgi:hypothetical protein
MKWLALLLVVGCHGAAGGRSDADGSHDAPGTDVPEPELDAAVLDGAVLDGAVLDAAMRDAAVDAASDGPPSCTWQAETVASSADPSRPVIAVDPDGGIHILFYDPTGCHSVQYAYKAPGATTWTVAPLDNHAGEDAQYFSLAMDAAGGLHASYFEGSAARGCVQLGAGVRYANKPLGGPWTTFQAARPSNGGQESSIDVDGSGEVHIVYDGTPNTLPTVEHASGMQANWTVETVPSTDPFSGFPSIRVDPMHRLHVSAMSATSTIGMVYAERSPTGTWTTTPVDATARGTSSIDVDGAGGVHIAYSDQALSILRYATRPPGGSWSTTALDTNYVMAHETLRVDTHGIVHIIYSGGSPFNGIPLEVRHAYAPIGGSWTIEPIGTDTPVFGTSFAFGPGDSLHIVYAVLRSSLWDVRYAHLVCDR